MWLTQDLTDLRLASELLASKGGLNPRLGHPEIQLTQDLSSSRLSQTESQSAKDPIHVTLRLPAQILSPCLPARLPACLAAYIVAG